MTSVRCSSPATGHFYIIVPAFFVVSQLATFIDHFLSAMHNSSRLCIHNGNYILLTSKERVSNNIIQASKGQIKHMPNKESLQAIKSDPTGIWCCKIEYR